MKLSELKKKLAKMTDEQIEDYLGDMQDRGKYEKIVLDGPYADMFDFGVYDYVVDAVDTVSAKMALILIAA